jgi:hypothetical protein
MIDDEIRQTRCGICDAEHEYKGGKVPTPRRKTQPPALFTQVLDTMNGPVPQVPAPHPAAEAVIDPEPVMMAAAVPEPRAAVATPKPRRSRGRTGRPRRREPFPSSRFNP